MRTFPRTASLPRTLSLTLWLAITALSALPAVAQPDDQPINLRPKFVAGQTARYEFWTRRDVQQTFEFDGRSNSASHQMLIEGQSTWRVDSVRPDGSAECTMTMDWIKVTLSGQGDKKVVDSRQSQGDPAELHTVLRAMTENPVKLSVAADGTVGKVTGVDKIRRAVGPELAESIDERDFIENAYDLALIPAAPADASVGKSWSFAYDSTHEAGVFTLDQRYELAGVEPIASIPVATVTSAAKIRFEPKKPPHLPAGAKIDVKLQEGSAQGQTMWDLSLGLAVGRNQNRLTVIQTQVKMEGRSFSQTMRDQVQSQSLRIEEK
ncbi:MAG: hypothetical protein IT441_06995 [Phycisphaeraceae bacterium]|nr:hypothetical protein [Phycisphaeraceae bacterium]